MLRYISDRIDGWDLIPLRRFLWINLFVCAFVMVSHVGATLISKDFPRVVYVTIPVSVVLLSLSIFALVSREREQPILKFQSAVIMVGWLGALAFSVDLALNGVPPDIKRVSWNPVLFALVCAYPIYLMRRAFFIKTTPPLWLKYSPIVAILVSALIRGLVFWQIGETF